MIRFIVLPEVDTRSERIVAIDDISFIERDTIYLKSQDVTLDLLDGEYEQIQGIIFEETEFVLKVIGPTEEP